jgi:hypothetical protein
MPAIINLQLSLQDLANAIASLSLEEKWQLQEILEQQIFEGEEMLYKDDLETSDEIQTVKAEYAAGYFLTQYLINCFNQS